MRIRNRYHIKGFAWGAGLTAVIDIGMQWWEHQQQDRQFTWENFDGQRTFRRAMIGGAAGTGIGELLYQARRQQQRQQPFYADRHLYKILLREKLSSDPALLKKVESFRKRIKAWIMSEFEGHLAAAPEDSGSYYKKTQVAGNFDLDIIIPFSRSAHRSLEHMSDDTYESLKHSFGREADITRHSRAITLCFTSGNDDVCIDIVPGREIGCYHKDHLLNLYVRPDYFWQTGTSFKTNVRKQQFVSVHTPHTRNVIMLLKIYRDLYCSKLPTIHIDMAVSEAIRRGSYGVHRSLLENLLNSMDLLACKLEQEAVWDCSNTNNNLNNKLSWSERTHISNLLLKDIERVQEDKHYLKEIFEL
jgi:hypothetical protein